MELEMESVSEQTKNAEEIKTSVLLNITIRVSAQTCHKQLLFRPCST